MKQLCPELLDSTDKMCKLYIYYLIKEDFMAQYDMICDEGIDLLMDIFYAKIRSDTNGVGDIFNNSRGISRCRFLVLPTRLF